MKNLLYEFIKAKENKQNRPISISLLGFGGTNRLIFDALIPLKNIELTVRQNRLLCESLPSSVKVYSGDAAFLNLYEDVLIPSPSVRREGLTIPHHSEVITDYDLLFRSKPKRLFSISGSDGKSTTTQLTSLMLRDQFPTLFSGGNIGTPLILANKDSEAFLLELSSFTLRYSIPSSTRALLTNVTPNHLDWHENIDEYRDTKLTLIRHADEPILNLCDEVSEDEARHTHSFCLISTRLTHQEIIKKYKTEHTVTLERGHILFDNEILIPISEVKRSEKHNITNFCSAIAMSIGYADKERIMAVAREFDGLRERCECFTAHGIKYISSSIDTTPERTRTTLEGLGQKVNIILGGRSKKLPLEPLRVPLIRYAKKISLYGEAAEEMRKFIDSDKQLSKIPHDSFSNLAEAIDYALTDVKSGDTVLLSPAATSYGEFENYIQRGKFFKEYISKI